MLFIIVLHSVIGSSFVYRISAADFYSFFLSFNVISESKIEYEALIFCQYIDISLLASRSS